MEKVIVGIGASAVLTLLVFLACILGTAGGCLAGWLVGMVWPHTCATWLAQFHLHFQMWQVGALLGFVGSFFRSSQTNNSNG